MPDLTYTANGTFKSDRKISVKICIPAEPFGGSYITELYNLSKKTSTGSINVIFCNFSNQNPDALQHIRFDYTMEFDLSQLSDHLGAVPFDETQSDCLFIFFHNTGFMQEDRVVSFSNIESIYDTVKKFGNQSQDGLLSKKQYASSRVPRKAGMSLIVHL